MKTRENILCPLEVIFIILSVYTGRWLLHFPSAHASVSSTATVHCTHLASAYSETFLSGFSVWKAPHTSHCRSGSLMCALWMWNTPHGHWNYAPVYSELNIQNPDLPRVRTGENTAASWHPMASSTINGGTATPHATRLKGVSHCESTS